MRRKRRMWRGEKRLGWRGAGEESRRGKRRRWTRRRKKRRNRKKERL